MEEPPNEAMEISGCEIDQSFDKTMDSTSPHKRTIVLGVVDTTGMKSSNLNRKKRWDQAPEEIDGSSPIPKKVFIRDRANDLGECLESPTYSSDHSSKVISRVIDTEEHSDEGVKCRVLCQNNSLIDSSTTVCAVTDVSQCSDSVVTDNLRLGITTDKTVEDQVEGNENTDIAGDDAVQSSHLISPDSNSLELKWGEQPVTCSRVELIPKTVASTTAKQPTIVTKHSSLNSGTVERSFISDELKRIQFSYDEGDSNSSEMYDSNIQEEIAEQGKVEIVQNVVSKNDVKTENVLDNTYLELNTESPQNNDNYKISILSNTSNENDNSTKREIDRSDSSIKSPEKDSSAQFLLKNQDVMIDKDIVSENVIARSSEKDLSQGGMGSAQSPLKNQDKVDNDIVSESLIAKSIEKNSSQESLDSSAQLLLKNQDVVDNDIVSESSITKRSEKDSPEGSLDSSQGSLDSSAQVPLINQGMVDNDIVCESLINVSPPMDTTDNSEVLGIEENSNIKGTATGWSSRESYLQQTDKPLDNHVGISNELGSENEKCSSDDYTFHSESEMESKSKPETKIVNASLTDCKIDDINMKSEVFDEPTKDNSTNLIEGYNKNPAPQDSNLLLITKDGTLDDTSITNIQDSNSSKAIGNKEMEETLETESLNVIKENCSESLNELKVQCVPSTESVKPSVEMNQEFVLQLTENISEEQLTDIEEETLGASIPDKDKENTTDSELEEVTATFKNIEQEVKESKLEDFVKPSILEVKPSVLEEKEVVKDLSGVDINVEEVRESVLPVEESTKDPPLASNESLLEEGEIVKVPVLEGQNVKESILDKQIVKKSISEKKEIHKASILKEIVSGEVDQDESVIMGDYVTDEMIKEDKFQSIPLVGNEQMEEENISEIHNSIASKESSDISDDQPNSNAMETDSEELSQENLKEPQSSIDTNNIDPAVMEVIFGSNGKQIIVDSGREDGSPSCAALESDNESVQKGYEVEKPNEICSDVDSDLENRLLNPEEEQKEEELQSNIQLDETEFEIDSAEIVTVDPTKPLIEEIVVEDEQNLEEFAKTKELIKEVKDHSIIITQGAAEISKTTVTQSIDEVDKDNLIDLKEDSIALKENCVEIDDSEKSQEIVKREEMESSVDESLKIQDPLGEGRVLPETQIDNSNEINSSSEYVDISSESTHVLDPTPANEGKNADDTGIALCNEEKVKLESSILTKLMSNKTKNIKDSDSLTKQITVPLSEAQVSPLNELNVRIEESYCIENVKEKPNTLTIQKGKTSSEETQKTSCVEAEPQKQPESPIESKMLNKSDKIKIQIESELSQDSVVLEELGKDSTSKESESSLKQEIFTIEDSDNSYEDCMDIQESEVVIEGEEILSENSILEESTTNINIVEPMEIDVKLNPVARNEREVVKVNCEDDSYSADLIMHCEEEVSEDKDLMDKNSENSEKVPVEVITIDSSESDNSKDAKPINVPITQTNISQVPLLKTVYLQSHHKESQIKIEPMASKKEIPGKSKAQLPPNLTPITLKIFKENLSEGGSKSPLSVDIRSQSSPQTMSPISKSNLSPQTKQLEFTLKIAKDATTNFPKAIMSPKSTLSPTTTVWKTEGSGTGALSPSLNKEMKSSKEIKVNNTLQLHSGVSIKTETVEEIHEKSKKTASSKKDTHGLPPPLVKIEDLESPQAQSNLQDMFKKMLEKGTSPILENQVKQELPEISPIVLTPKPSPRKRGRPRKIIVPSDESTSRLPPHTFSTPDSVDPNDPDPNNRPMRSCRGRTKPIVVRTRKPRGGGVIRGGTRGRGSSRPLQSERECLSEYEKAELAKIVARKEKLRLEQIAKYKAKKEKKILKKLKDEERRKKVAKEKAEKAEAAAPQVFEEETRMSAPESGSRGHTPAPSRVVNQSGEPGEESQNSISCTPISIKKGRMEIPIDFELSKEVRVDQLAEYQWQGSELFLIQEQVSLYLGVKSFKRKYPDLKRRPVEAEERTFLEDSGLVPKSMCDLGLTAVSSAEVLDVMFHDFPDKYEEFRKYVREKQAREASSKQKAFALARKDVSKIEPREQALEAVASWNANLNRERREERRCALDLQTFTVHYPKTERETMTRPMPKVGLYPLSVIPGQYCDFYKEYTPTELMYFPLNTVLYGPLRPNEKHREDNSDGSVSDSDDTSSSDDFSETTSDSDSSDDADEDTKCKACNGNKKSNKNSQFEALIQCSNCKKTVHPTCLDLTVEMLPHIKKYEWHCPDCKKCVTCKETGNPDKLMSCDLCNRGYHIYCVGLRKIPEGRWHCTICSYCTSCGTRDPVGSDWQHEFKKSEKGAKVYQRTLCTPCFKLWRKGKYCQICFKCHGWKPEEETGLRQCNTCDRWIHKECFNIRFGVPNKVLNSGFQCDICQERIQSSLSSHGIPRPLIKV